ncbi:hypothetical protein [Phyllobacterium sp. YR531]|uniref:hypothetical protein n=1 Tax=Phyllobacterium sp. YR531 TaxID=1144343 RepID=UPI0005940A55|nr:hypothetical protein [Phyllobacterium sp. YR531]
MKKQVILAFLFVVAGVSAGHAQSCEGNFKVTGVPLITAMTYKTSYDFPKVKADQVLKALAQAVAAEGFLGIQVNKSLGAIDAYQETTGSGREQTLRIVARKKGTGTRVDAMFNIQQGQVTSEKVVRKGLCDIVMSATD